MTSTASATTPTETQVTEEAWPSWATTATKEFLAKSEAAEKAEKAVFARLGVCKKTSRTPAALKAIADGWSFLGYEVLQLPDDDPRKWNADRENRKFRNELREVFERVFEAQYQVGVVVDGKPLRIVGHKLSDACRARLRT